ncbi:hypothetical protein [Lysobacter gummosus]|uniref:hypothetical protein n=1 Tax=Lysobacter gummosus TaxID=262324 RepID=UPI0036392B30
MLSDRKASGLKAFPQKSCRSRGDPCGGLFRVDAFGSIRRTPSNPRLLTQPAARLQPRRLSAIAR